jgi:tRNA(Met) C34 N-acetyltransferase TmcA
LRYPLRPCNCKIVVVVVVVAVVVAVAAYDDDAVVDNRIVQIMSTVSKILGNLIPSVLKKHFNLITAED